MWLNFFNLVELAGKLGKNLAVATVHISIASHFLLVGSRAEPKTSVPRTY
jgi:hypothetical protein